MFGVAALALSLVAAPSIRFFGRPAARVNGQIMRVYLTQVQDVIRERGLGVEKSA
jgi:hypothetical protein